MPRHSHCVTEFTAKGEPRAVDLLMADDAVFPQDDEDIPVPVDPAEEPEILADHPPAPARPARMRAPQADSAQDRDPYEPVSVYVRLTEYGLLRKVTDIVLAKVAVPWHLREDAAQEIHATWASIRAKPNFARNQLARYAYISGQHAALKLRRNIGAVVAIPGALFRTGRDTAFMEAIGAAVNPKDVEDYKDSLELSIEADDYAMPPQTVSPEYFKARLAGLALSKSQRAIAEYVLLKRMSADSIAQIMGVRVSYVERLAGQVATLLNEQDDAKLRSATAKTRSARKTH